VTGAPGQTAPHVHADEAWITDKIGFTAETLQIGMPYIAKHNQRYPVAQ